MKVLLVLLALLLSGCATVSAKRDGAKIKYTRFLTSYDASIRDGDLEIIVGTKSDIEKLTDLANALRPTP